MSIYGVADSERYRNSILGKIPTWGWWILLYVLMVGSNFFLTQGQINALPFTMWPWTTRPGNLEAGNLVWMHFIYGIGSVLIFELVLWLYYQIAFMASKTALGVSRREFAGTFRAFYCLYLVAAGLFQILYFYVPLASVYGAALFGLVVRFLAVLGFFFYLKKNYLKPEYVPQCVLAIFIPYFVYEVISLFLL